MAGETGTDLSSGVVQEILAALKPIQKDPAEIESDMTALKIEVSEMHKKWMILSSV